MTSHNFDSDEWIEDKRLDIVKLIFKNEFGIDDFRHTFNVI